MTAHDAAPFQTEADASGWQDFLLWTGALATVLACIGGGVYFIRNQVETAPGTPGIVPEAILLELAPLPSTTEEAVADVAPDQQVMQQQEDVAPSQEPLEKAEPPPGPIIDEPPVEQPLPPPEPIEEEAAPESPPLPPEEPPVEDMTEPMPPPVETEAEVASDPALPMPVQQSARLLEQRQAEKPTQQRPPEQKAAPRTAAPPPTTAPPSQQTNSAPTGTNAPVSKATVEQWQLRVISYLDRRKKYPRSAQLRGEQGRTLIAFSMDAKGNVLSARIANSSGFAELDQEALNLVSRSSPLPAPPQEMGQGQKNLTVPISFNL